MNGRSTLSYRLLKTLQRGKKQLSKDAVHRISAFVESQRTDEEAFIGKNGKADLYYTLFGWMLSYILGAGLDTRKMKEYVERIEAGRLDFIHYAAYMRCLLLIRLMEAGKAGVLLRLLSPVSVAEPDDCSRLPHNDPCAPYTQFIRLSLQEDTGRRIKDKEYILRSLAAYRLPGGGYMNTQDGLTATTNATVAALAVSGQLNGYKDNADIRYLHGLQHPSGGFSAAQGSPVPDLLSTATALFMLHGYGIPPKYAANDFITAHWLEQGGFSATLLEDKSDVEYTFYGLLALGSLA